MVADPGVRLRFVFRSLRIGQVLLALAGFALPFALALFPLAGVQGAPLSWERVRSYPGDPIVRRVVAGQSGQLGVLYAVGARSGLYLSLDEGQRWSWVGGGLPESTWGQVRIVDLAVDPADASLAYAVVASPPRVPRPMVYWTANMGLSWQPRASLRQERVRAIALNPLNGNPYVVTAHDVLRGFIPEGADKGLTPRERFARGLDDLQWLSLSSLDGRTLATSLTVVHPSVTVPAEAGPLNHTLRPTSQAAAGPSPEAQEDLAEAPLLYVGTEGKGLSIVVDSSSPGPQPLPAQEDEDTRYVRQRATIYALCADPYWPGRVYVSTERGIYVSRDAGRSWHPTAHPLRARRVYALVTDPVIADTLYAGLAGGGVYSSQDAGATWQPLGQGLGRASVFSLAVSVRRVLYAGTDHGLWRLPLQ